MKAWHERPRSVSIVVDTPGWFDLFAQRLCEAATELGDRATVLRDSAEVPDGGIAFYLSCMKLTPPAVLARSVLNVVVHASALPLGRGFSPVVWQVLAGCNEIPITMIEAVEEADAGKILMRDSIVLEGHELNGEMRDRLGEKIVSMCTALLKNAKPPQGIVQEGETSWYRRRKPEDSRLDVDRSLADLFELLRVVDNDSYPAFFDHRGHRYVLRIEKQGPILEPDAEKAVAPPRSCG